MKIKLLGEDKLIIRAFGNTVIDKLADSVTDHNALRVVCISIGLLVRELAVKTG